MEILPNEIQFKIYNYVHNIHFKDCWCEFEKKNKSRLLKLIIFSYCELYNEESLGFLENDLGSWLNENNPLIYKVSSRFQRMLSNNNITLCNFLDKWITSIKDIECFINEMSTRELYDFMKINLHSLH